MPDLNKGAERSRIEREQNAPRACARQSGRLRNLSDREPLLSGCKGNQHGETLCERLQVCVGTGRVGLQWEQRRQLGGERRSPQRMRTHVLRAVAGDGHLSFTVD